MTLRRKPIATQLQDEIEYGENGMFRKYLVKDRQRQAMLICLQAGTKIPFHASKHDGLITVIQGRGVFSLAGREVALTPGVFVELPANTRHALTAIEDLAMLKVVESHEPPASIDIEQEHQPTCAESIAEMLKPFLQDAGIAESTITEPFAKNLCQSIHQQ